MGRLPRIWFPGAWYHIFSRGDNKEPIFFIDKDYRKYLSFLKEGVNRYECNLHAYALMTNHVHLVIETGHRYPIFKLMHWLQAKYTKYINWSHNRVGHLFQGRYRSRLIEEDSYLLELSRYIHLNPVKAGIVKNPMRYEWSSCKSYLKRNHGDLVRTDYVLGLLSLSVEQRPLLYKQFLQDGSKRLRLVSGTKHEKSQIFKLGA